ncbi:unnamed protein product [Cuscuta epithymum]|uniref:Transposase Tnp1/En/Spm-like domain-containing protein n=2 Tax=Cuscuta epithymum TaxID=186058 RepID=A0AAV0BVA8_9ASTE|nr:unnamed protein product [Cuscuta epithymum]
MGCLWRASKSRLVSKIRATKKKEQRLKLKPDNIPSLAAWKRFIKIKTSPSFKAISDKFKAMRRKQMPHTCSRKGMVRLAVDMKRASADPSTVSRVKVWIKGHTKKDGTAVNSTVGETIDKLKEIESDTPSSSSTNIREDALSQVLGKDKPGQLRGMGRGATISKISFLQARDKHVVQLKEENVEFRSRIQHLENLVQKLVAVHGNEEADHDPGVDKTSHLGMRPKLHGKCNLLDWCGKDEVVAEGHLCSSDPKGLVNNAPLGPNAMEVMVDITNKPDAFLWRPTSNMLCMKQAVGKTIAWPADKVVRQITQNSENEDNTSLNMDTNISHIRCKIFNWTGKDEIVAQGHWISSDPKMIVNGIPLGP